jgi:hypothetical protein
MKKLKLDLEAVVVESFSVEPTRPARGTVRGNVETGWGQTCGMSCPGAPNTYCVCNPDTEPETWWEGCSGDTCQVEVCHTALQGGVSCPDTQNDSTCVGCG